MRPVQRTLTATVLAGCVATAPTGLAQTEQLDDFVAMRRAISAAVGAVSSNEITVKSQYGP